MALVGDSLSICDRFWQKLSTDSAKAERGYTHPVSAASKKKAFVEKKLVAFTILLMRSSEANEFVAISTLF